MINSVDDDGSGQIEFREFCLLIKNSNKDEQTAKLNKFFKDLSNGSLGSKDLSFNVIYSDIRRKYMMERFVGDDEQRKKGKRILENVGA